MAAQASFDITSDVDLQEVDNAVNQARKEIAQRYDFKGSKSSIDFKRDENLIALVSDKPTTLELRELSLAIDTPDGIVLLVGCSHPGIDKIVEAAIAISPRIHLIAGGFHLVVAKDPDIENIVMTLRDKFKVAYVAPGHCTGEPTFTALKKAFGDRYLYAGLGTALAIGATPRAISRAGQQATTGLEEDDVQSYRMLFATSVEDGPTLMAYRRE